MDENLGIVFEHRNFLIREMLLQLGRWYADLQAEFT